jgi:hypothetical protein
VDYPSLTDQHKNSLEQNIAATVATSITGVAATDVAVALGAGSVKVDATISTTSRNHADNAVAEITTNTAAVKASIITSVASVAGLPTTGTLSIASVLSIDVVPRVDCKGLWEEGPCYGGLQARSFKMLVPPSGSGAACPTEDVIVSSCQHEQIHLNWSYVVPKASWAAGANAENPREIPMVICPKGSKVVFGWTGVVHDIWQLPDEDSYNLCRLSATGAMKQYDASTTASFQFDCEAVGTHYFACSVEDACSNGHQKVRIYVSDPQNTVKLRARGGVSLEQFNRDYTMLFAGYHLNNQPLTQNNADQALAKAESVLAKSPESCSDWILPSINTDKICKAFIYTDLGFISRVRPDADFEASERYYNQALEIIPGMCGATAYLTELRVQQNRRIDADVLLCETYDVCGRDSFDFHDVRFSYNSRNWTLPSCIDISTTISSKAGSLRGSLTTSDSSASDEQESGEAVIIGLVVAGSVLICCALAGALCFYSLDLRFGTTVQKVAAVDNDPHDADHETLAAAVEVKSRPDAVAQRGPEPKTTQLAKLGANNNAQMLTGTPLRRAGSPQAAGEQKSAHLAPAASPPGAAGERKSAHLQPAASPTGQRLQRPAVTESTATPGERRHSLTRTEGNATLDARSNSAPTARVGAGRSAGAAQEQRGSNAGAAQEQRRTGAAPAQDQRRTSTEALQEQRRRSPGAAQEQRRSSGGATQNQRRSSTGAAQEQRRSRPPLRERSGTEPGRS